MEEIRLQVTRDRIQGAGFRILDIRTRLPVASYRTHKRTSRLRVAGRKSHATGLRVQVSADGLIPGVEDRASLRTDI